MVNPDRRRELLEKLSELKRKKQEELDDLESRKKRELKEAEEMLRAGEEDLSAEEEEMLENLRNEIPALRELKEAKKEEVSQEGSLEEVIEGEKISKEVKEKLGPSYDIPIEDTIKKIYQVTDYNSYNELRESLEKVEKGEYLSKSERGAIYQLQDELESISTSSDLLGEKDPFGYVERSKQVMESIHSAMKSRTQYKIGDDHA
ncbi:MAG: hypothetical protein ABH828_00220 [archaeon]